MISIRTWLVGGLVVFSLAGVGAVAWLRPFSPSADLTEASDRIKAAEIAQQKKVDEANLITAGQMLAYQGLVVEERVTVDTAALEAQRREAQARAEAEAEAETQRKRAAIEAEAALAQAPVEPLRKEEEEAAEPQAEIGAPRKRLMRTARRAGVPASAAEAHAADLAPPAYKAPAYVAPAQANWTGFYLGFNAGYGFGKSDWDIPAVSPSPKGFVGGGTIGYNLQTGDWVWGLEGDFDYSALKDSAAAAGGSYETKNAWLATARGRIGYAGWNNVLPYITGGAAFGEVTATAPSGASASKTQVGWTVGGGLEYALATNWSVKVEYLYVDLGKFDAGSSLGLASDNVSVKANIVRAGLNFRF